MNKPDKECLSPLKLFERLIRLETQFETSSRKDAEALVLSRTLLEKETTIARLVVDNKLEHLNEYQRRMDKLTDTFATRESLEGVKKLIWIGMGVIVALQVIFPVLIHVYGKR